MATVVGENRNGTFDVRFRDGDEEKHLDPSMIRELGCDDGSGGGRESASSSAVDKGADRREAFRAGDTVEARFGGKSRWFAGVVDRTHSDGTYDIRYADGDEERFVDGSLVRLAEGRHSPGRGKPDVESRTAQGESYRVSEKVEARFGGRGRWFSATVERENRDGTYHLLYADGDEERNVHKDLMRKIQRGGARSGSKSPGRRVISGASSEAELSAQASFHQGDKVEARYKRGRKWFVGVIRSVDSDGKFDIRYNDGDTENGVDPGYVRRIGVGSADSLTPAAEGKGKHDFAEGEMVEARFGGRSRWFKATIRRKNRDGTYHLLYADGDEEKSVEKDLIRRVGKADDQDKKSTNRAGMSRAGDADAGSATSNKLRVGDEIEARYKGGRKWHPGVIRAANKDGTYDIRYKDGDNERGVEPSFVRVKGTVSVDSLASDAGGPASSVDFSKGDKVEARFGGRARWFKATVERENRDGTYHLLYADGDEEKAVEKDLIRRVGGTGSSSSTVVVARSRSPNRRMPGETESEPELKQHRVGDDVEARYKRGHKWYPGVIRATNRNGTYDIRYKDGDVESDVEATFVRGTGMDSRDSLASSTDGDRGFAEGDRVEARFKGRFRWLKATIDRKNPDGTYNLLYDDGDEERSVEKELIRHAERASIRNAAQRVMSSGGEESDVQTTPARRAPTIRVGDDIEARYKRGHKWYPGVVRAANKGGMYDIRYKDGDTEYDVDASFVRVTSVDSLGSEADLKEAREYLEGDKVEARFGGRSRWFKAKVVRKNRDGTYHLRYDDGDEERAVEKTHMRRVGGEAPTEKKGEKRGGVGSGDRETSSDNGQNKRHVGDDIEGRYKKGSKWYPGVVQEVNRDGTYDIRYKDGDTERTVEPGMIRGKGGASASSLDSMSTEFLEGDKVEARFGGRSRWVKATVERKNRDGSYYLRYADGDEERAVEKKLIRKVGAAASPGGSKSPGRRVVSGAPPNAESSVKTYRVGDEVEARYKKGRKWFPGVIGEVNRDGTYDVRYSDGDAERDVEPGLIRGVGVTSATSLTTNSSAGSSDTANLTVGENVEARFGGRSRWFKATVERENRDGTYHLLYADGDEEKRVAKYLIRKIDGGARSGSKSPGRRVVSGVGGNSDAEPRISALRVGDEIEARYKRGRKWFPGVIRVVNHDGTYDVRYNDGDDESSVEPGLIRGKGVGSVDSLDLGNEGTIAAGDKVEARFGGRSRWFKATVERRNRDGTYHLLYADGDEERAVERDLIRKGSSKAGEVGRVEPGLSRGKHSSLDSLDSDVARNYRVGDKVEARFGGRSRWFTATVERDNRDGTYCLMYADGDQEREVDKDLIRRPVDQRKGTEAKRGENGESEVRGKAYRIGDDIEARYKRGQKWYPGIIRAVNRNGTYDIRYSDGDIERDVEAGLVRKVGLNAVDSVDSVGDTKGSSDYSVGDEVEARFGGRPRWFKATIKCKNRDGTYHLLYADGDEERSVQEDLIRRLDGDANQPRSSRSVARPRVSDAKASDVAADRPETKRGELSDRGGRKNQLRAGDKIEARFAGGVRWFPGRVTRTHHDGTYDVAYSDGENETYVPAKLVRRADGEHNRIDTEDGRPGSGGHCRGEAALAIKCGDIVEARLGGRSSWQEGEVTRVHSDGTYDIRYRKGDQEKRVDARMVRIPETATSRGTTRGGRRGSTGSSSDTDYSRGRSRRRSNDSRSENQIQEVAPSEDGEGAAARVWKALRKTGKSVDYLTQKLEQKRKPSGHRDSRGRSVASGIDRHALDSVLARLGIGLSSREATALARDCEDVQAGDGCIDPSALASLVNGQRGRSEKREGSANSRKQHDSPAAARARRHRSSSTDSDRSTESRTKHRRAAGARRREDSASSASGGNDSEVGRRRRRESVSCSSRNRREAGARRGRSGDRSRSVGRKGGNDVATSSEKDGEGTNSTSSEPDYAVAGKEGGVVASNAVLKALKKLEGPAFDGGLRRAFEEFHSGRDETLSRSQLKR